MDGNLDIIQDHLNELTELSEKINNCQNLLREYEQNLNNNYERDKKLLIDLRLKFGNKIEESKIYYNILDEIKKLDQQKENLQNQLIQQKEELHQHLTEKTPDELFINSELIKLKREAINTNKLEQRVITINCDSMKARADKLAKKYRESIAKTRDYFQLKQTSYETSCYLTELVNKQKASLIGYRKLYADRMKLLERLSSEIHDARQQVQWTSQQKQKLMMDNSNNEVHNETDPARYRLLDDYDEKAVVSGNIPQSYPISKSIPFPTNRSQNPNRYSHCFNLCADLSSNSISSLASPLSNYPSSPTNSVNLPPIKSITSLSTPMKDNKCPQVTWHPLM